MKTFAVLCFSFAILGLGCAATTDDVTAQDSPTNQTTQAEQAAADPPDDGSEENTGSTSQALSGSCRWHTVGCCNFGKSPRRAWQCFGAGQWNTQYYRCATELRCAL